MPFEELLRVFRIAFQNIPHAPDLPQPSVPTMAPQFQQPVTFMDPSFDNTHGDGNGRTGGRSPVRGEPTTSLWSGTCDLWNRDPGECGLSHAVRPVVILPTLVDPRLLDRAPH